MRVSMRSTRMTAFLSAITQPLQVSLDNSVELVGYGHMLAQHGREPVHLFLERFTVFSG